jgi:hypothetical protein
MRTRKHEQRAGAVGREAGRSSEKAGGTGPPVIAGDPRTDQALLALPRLVMEIARNPRRDEARQPTTRVRRSDAS